MRAFLDVLGGVACRAVDEAVALLVPESCVVCGRAGRRLCTVCRGELRPVVERREVDGLSVWSGLRFGGAAATVLRVCKSDGRPRLAGALAPALAAAMIAAAEASVPDGGTVRAVPIPASARSLRERGFHVVETVMRGAGVAPHRALRIAGVAGDQRGLGVGDRSRNVAGMFRAVAAGGEPVVLVDDVVTTGATLLEAARALRSAGVHVVGAATVASTPLRGSACPGRTPSDVIG